MFSHHLQSSNFVPFALSRERRYTAADITAVISIRAHQGNPWVLERLALLAGYYDPAPAIQIVDFGSAAPYAARIQAACEHGGFLHHRVEDSGIFSLSIARNEGACAARTDLLYFTDIDFFSTPSHFGDLAKYAEEHDFGTIRDIVLNLPALHLLEDVTGEFLRVSPGMRSKYLAQLGSVSMEKTGSPLVDFIAPYSNNFLCTRDFFQLVGGYDPVFRGHGSEDFELMVRMAHYVKHADLPAGLTEDLHKPNHISFRSPRAYAGFRRLGEAVSFRGESEGFRAFHLWHPTPWEDPWREANDWKRDTFAASLSNYLETPEKLASIDFLPRPKRALCVCKDAEHYGYFLPFRILGYQLLPIPSDSAADLEAARSRIANREADLFLIFNPYMKSHSKFLELFHLAKASGIEVAVVERGALPSSTYFAPDVSYNDPDFGQYDEHPPVLTLRDLAAADAVAARIRGGGWTLESLSGYEATRAACAKLAARKATRVFIPLQLSDDMAVTRFVAPTQSYPDFEAAIAATAASHPELVFVIKAHPLKRDSFPAAGPNIVVCANDDNVHAMIDVCDAVICYNSGVGLLALIHGKPVVTIGNAFYNVAGTGNRADSLADAANLIARGAANAPSAEAVRRFLAWLVTRKYSFFAAGDQIREFEHRNSHGYRDIRVTHLNWNGLSLPLGRISGLSRISRTSYINGRLGLMMGISPDSFNTPLPRQRGPIKSFLIRYIKKPVRRAIQKARERNASTPTQP